MLEKLRDNFDDMLVYKDLQKSAFFSALSLPSFLRDWLLKRYSNEEGEYDVERLTAFVNKYLPTRDQWQELQDRLMNNGEEVKIFAKINAHADVKTNMISFDLPDLGVRSKDTIIEPLEWNNIEDHASLLSSRDAWGLLTRRYRFPQLDVKPKVDGKIRLIDFNSFCPYQPDLDFYRDVSREFEFDEWLDVLLGAIDYNADGFKDRAHKLAMLTRILPFLEKRLNLIELAPKGTGKSYLYGRVSRYGWLASGGKLTRAKMFYDMTSKSPGLVSSNDYVVLDEVQTIVFDEVDELRAAFKGYLEQGVCTVGNAEVKADAGLVLSGNISQSYMNEYQDMFTELPEEFHESALIDRFHGFIKGWEIPRMTDDLKMHGWGLNTEYFTTILHMLRSAPDFRSVVDQLILVPEGADTRDTEAVKRITTAYLKLFFPYVRCVEDVPLDDFTQYCFNRALKMRKIIKYQLGILDPDEFGGKDVPNLRVRDDL